MKAQNPSGSARRRSHTRQESAPSSPMEGLLSSPPPLQQPFPLPQRWPAPEPAAQRVPLRQSSGFDPALEQIGDVTWASQHGRESTLGDAPAHAEARVNRENFTIDNGKISIRQQPRMPAPDARSDIHRQQATKPPPNRLSDFDAVAQMDAALYLKPPSRSNVNARKPISSDSAYLEIEPPPISHGQAASNLSRPHPARSTPQLKGRNQAPSNLSDPFVRTPPDEPLATTDLVPLTRVTETMDYSRPIQSGDEVHVLGPERNDRSGVVTYTVTGMTSEGDICSIRPIRDLVVPTSRLLRAQVHYNDLVQVFQPKLHTRNGHQILTVEAVDSGFVKERTVVNGERRYTVINSITQHRYTNLDDNMIALVDGFNHDAGEPRLHSNGDGPV
ncbi:hypothetical protein LTR70_001655 [Exophiala xenobiotica]|uniref:Uncharacterized protein n=1 Tax=Lithohypha guttulata TaxID=1690604 RepID=A0ABR0KHC9_9EURO|nr:hypothetical protein LTR24_002546 [Lithohypha guttulata]KAK5327180.1 hypothetical protein LTR70_001655 [Exophiala xenobiotica]